MVDRYRELDGLRAFAILGVMYAHFYHEESAVGSLGVLLFFVLSGYLISGILLRCRDQIEAGDASFGGVLKAFYMRRVLRILPVYYVCLVLIFIFGDPAIRAQLLWHAGFASNFYFSSHPFTGLTGHFWTLSVEEQFYLLWPAVILLVPRRFMIPLLILIIASAPVYRFVAPFFGLTDASVIMTIACFDSLGTGALLACLERGGGGRDWLLRLGVLSIPAPLYLAAFGHAPDRNIQNALQLLCGFAFAFLIAEAVKGAPVLRFLRSRLLVGIGIVSYGAYVLHLPLFELAQWQHLISSDLQRGPAMLALGAALTLVAASASWVFLEKPINALKVHWPYGNRTRAAKDQGGVAAAASSDV
jgi:peptidoglycan/LPS O-acetylase OafA/YrhL